MLFLPLTKDHFMIRTIITPETQTVFFNIPKDYVGKELEVIAFARDEETHNEKTNLTMTDFWGSLSDDTADDLNNQLQSSRNDWEQRLNKQI